MRRSADGPASGKLPRSRAETARSFTRSATLGREAETQCCTEKRGTTGARNCVSHAVKLAPQMERTQKGGKRKPSTAPGESRENEEAISTRRDRQREPARLLLTPTLTQLRRRETGTRRHVTSRRRLSPPTVERREETQEREAQLNGRCRRIPALGITRNRGEALRRAGKIRRENADRFTGAWPRLAATREQLGRASRRTPSTVKSHVAGAGSSALPASKTAGKSKKDGRRLAAVLNRRKKADVNRRIPPAAVQNSEHTLCGGRCRAAEDFK
ncbi:hypothetical protein TGPRC2_293290 [Toxoplasma gondii TgCatPRC2]|uniref:Uncharacterized protein n=10 Tax=Toxoplasma gondii TaxID=5811 RepID=A0A125YRN4_TOXGV|nr:hypothetical protein TGME49_293290 [Toxoplasma gondii ME49]EPR57653.1 hypothetical protein TGGT1_293290 [Toxoplasma gondii GT1]ESS29226.1 hypothetical protein TGVEG_293290 [Toxoplasma gondii VEG]KAF4646073.1 hypothetical protein TGRH88_018600 [Toxoplasma gondii]KFG35821.1 hypothetical protein TGP89_293290 [Toxoplasma gondii p89]KFH14412.1 hypothetical protein TGMAS_293290 [Toxoplasma gondii MAS]KYF38889.1 hypothetical protein TGARI_293290 [Toxoplasma gondii ARI]KYK65990.1 hypothetical pro|eukprot:XP_018638629.1 hypothetical protein TGME49_293290 [Toxoplasma gondii ME49]